MSRESEVLSGLVDRSLGLPRWMNRVWVRDYAHLMEFNHEIPQEAHLVKQRTKNGIEMTAPIGTKYTIAINTKSEVYAFKDDTGTHVIEWCVYDLFNGGWIPMELLDIDQSHPPSHAEGLPSC